MLEITYRPLKAVIPYVKNSRTHSADSISKIAGSLREFGWAAPMLIADNVMIAGHARLSAALQLAEQGIPIPGNDDPWQGPTVDLSHLSKHQRAAYVLADNRLALDAGWDQDVLAEELGWLGEEGFDISLTGFEENELAALLGGTAPGSGADPERPLLLDLPDAAVGIGLDLLFPKTHHAVTSPTQFSYLPGIVVGFPRQTMPIFTVAKYHTVDVRQIKVWYPDLGNHMLLLESDSDGDKCILDCHLNAGPLVPLFLLLGY